MTASITSGKRYKQAEEAVLAALGSLEAVDTKYGISPQEVYLIRRRCEGEISYDRVNAALTRLVKDGRVLKPRRGYYVLPADSPYKPRPQQ